MSLDDLAAAARSRQSPKSAAAPVPYASAPGVMPPPTRVVPDWDPAPKASFKFGFFAGLGFALANLAMAFLVMLLVTLLGISSCVGLSSSTRNNPPPSPPMWPGR